MTYTNIYSAFQYTQASTIDSYPYSGRANTYFGGGYVFKMNGNIQAISESVKILESLDWIDMQTAAFFIEFTLFNPNVNLFEQCMILFEVLPSGTFVNTAQFKSMNILDINDTGLFTFKILMNIIYMAFIVIFIVVEIRMLVRIRTKYFFQFYNYIELLIIGFSWAAFSMYIYRMYSSYDIYHTISKNSKDLSMVFINLQYVANCDLLLDYFIGFCCALGSLRFIKLFRFNKQIIVFLHAFKKSLRDLSSFSIIFVVAWMSFVQLFYLSMNEQYIEFSSIPTSMKTSFQMIFGRFASLFLNTSFILGPIFYAVFIVCMIFILINIFLIIISDNYALACADKELDDDDPELFSYLKSLAGSVFFCCGQNKVSDVPVYKDMLDTLPNTFDSFVTRLNKVYFFCFSELQYYIYNNFKI